MRKKKDTHSFDFRPLGLAIREAREKAGLSRNDLGDKVFYGERHIADIENIGKHPSFQLFHDLVTMFNISVDEYLKFNRCLFCNRINIFLWCGTLISKQLSEIRLYLWVGAGHCFINSSFYISPNISKRCSICFSTSFPTIFFNLCYIKAFPTFSYFVVQIKNSVLIKQVLCVNAPP